MRGMAWTGVFLLLAAAGCGKEAEKKLADLKRALASVREDFTEYKDAKQREIGELKSQLEQKTQALAEAEKTRLNQAAEFAASARAKLKSLEEELAAKAGEAAAALQRSEALAKARDALANELQSVKTALADQANKIDSLTAELAKLKKFLGR